MRTSQLGGEESGPAAPAGSGYGVADPHSCAVSQGNEAQAPLVRHDSRLKKLPSTMPARAWRVLEPMANSCLSQTSGVVLGTSASAGRSGSRPGASETTGRPRARKVQPADRQ